jgi:tetratricopeptide (TPR) repeat protein
MTILVAGLLLANCSALKPDPVQRSSQAQTALRSGDYSGARTQFEAALEAAPAMEESQAGLLEALRWTGSYNEAIKRADAFLASRDASPAVHLERGRVAAARGDYAGAEKHFRRSMTLGGASRLDATRELADLLELTGRRGEGTSLWDKVLDEYRAGRTKTSRDLGTAGIAAWRRGYVQDSKDIFMDATEPMSPAVSLRTLSDFGYLFLDKYRFSDALGVFRDCLEVNKSYIPALLGVALAKKSESSGEAEKYARAALEVNPNLVPALNLLAEMRIEEENYEAAGGPLKHALEVNPSDLDSLTLQAVMSHMQGDAAGFARYERQVLAINPNHGYFYYTVAESLVNRRKYQEAVAYNRRALELNPTLWAAHAGLGMNLMRVGDLEQGRRSLQRAFEGDPFHVWAFNTLDLLDQMDKFSTVRSEHFVFRLAPEDEPVLSPYAPRLAEEAYSSLSRRYEFTPSGPLQVEIFPDHGGFAVRTLGLPGLGALGVCFGKVVALDSPRARKAGEFNWGSTLWHELAHVISLQMSNHNIPRWYSEGISVYEERRARPGWGDDLNLSVVKAYQDGKLLKVSELNAGMMRPKFPEQIALSYYQASLFCELVEQKFGFEKIRETLHLFARGKTSEAVFKEALGWDTATMDREYALFMDERLRARAPKINFAGVTSPHGTAAPGEPDLETLKRDLAKNPEEFFANLRLGALLHREKQAHEAETYLKKAQSLFPEFVEPGNPYQLLGELYIQLGNEEAALQQFLGWTRYDENAAPPLLKAAEIYGNRKDWASVTKVLEQAVYINPYDQELHKRLGEAANRAGNWTTAAAAYRVLLGLNPPDPAGAHLNLAEALMAGGKKQEARREVLKALEIAPSFDRAQQLLLQLSGRVP